MPAEAKRLHGHDVEMGPGSRGVEALQVVDFVDGRVAPISGWGQGCQQDDGAGIGFPNGGTGGGQELGIGNWLDMPVTPMGSDVRLIPDLVMVDPVTVARSQRRGEAGEGHGIGRWCQGIPCGRPILRCTCPCRTPI